VNARGFDLRLRLPPGFDSIEAAARSMLARHLGRGTCQATLTAEREAAPPGVRLNTEVLDALVEALRSARVGEGLGPAGEGALRGLDQAVQALLAMRRAEGDNLARIIEARLAAVDRLTDAAEASPARRPDAIRLRLAELVAALVDAAPSLDPNRLHQEAVLI